MFVRNSESVATVNWEQSGNFELTRGGDFECPSFSRYLSFNNKIGRLTLRTDKCFITDDDRIQVSFSFTRNFRNKISGMFTKLRSDVNFPQINIKEIEGVPGALSFYTLNSAQIIQFFHAINSTFHFNAIEDKMIEIIFQMLNREFPNEMKLENRRLDVPQV